MRSEKPQLPEDIRNIIIASIKSASNVMKQYELLASIYEFDTQANTEDFVLKLRTIQTEIMILVSSILIK